MSLPSKTDRIGIVFFRLKNAPGCGSADEMLAVLSATMNAVEDEFSGAPFDPDNWMTDGRLYPPQEDQRRQDPVPGVRRYRTRGHWIDISEDGAMRITRCPAGPVDLNKPSATNTEVPDV